MPPTPPPTVTSTDQHPLLLPDVNYPDARQYQPLPDSPTRSATPPPPQKQPDPRAKDGGTPRFEFPLPPRASQQTQQDTTRRQTDGNTALVNNRPDSHEGNHKDGPDPKRPIDSPPTQPAATTATAAAAAAAADITVDTSTGILATDPLVNKTDDDYDLSILKGVGYRRSGASGPYRTTTGLVHRGIGLVRRDAAGRYSRAGEIAAASATPGSGRLKEDELAGRYGALPWLLSIHSIYPCCLATHLGCLLPHPDPSPPPPPPRARGL